MLALGRGNREDYLQLTINPPFPSSFSDLFGVPLTKRLDAASPPGTVTSCLMVFALDDFNAALEEPRRVGPFMERHIEMWNSPARLLANAD